MYMYTCVHVYTYMYTHFKEILQGNPSGNPLLLRNTLDNYLTYDLRRAIYDIPYRSASTRFICALRTCILETILVIELHPSI